MIFTDAYFMKAKRKPIKKLKQKKSSNMMLLFLILFFGVIVSVFAITNSGSSTFELRKKADGITPTATPSATLTPTSTLTPTPTPKNVVPTCLGLSVSPLVGKTPLDLTLSCSGVDGNNDIVAAEFGLGGDQKRTVEKRVGQYGTIITTVRYDKPGSYVVTCRLKDNNNEWSNIPSVCSNTVKVSAVETVVSTPKPTPTPIYEEPIILKGTVETPTPTETILLPTSTPIPTPAKTGMSKDSMYMIGKILLISVVTIMVGLLLKKLISGDE